ncbi:unnamed protein product, partial [Staurois parvus]
MQGPGRADIVNAGSGETGYSEFRVRGAKTQRKSVIWLSITVLEHGKTQQI